MDLATVIGLLLAWGAVFVALTMEGGSLSSLMLAGPAVLVFGGTAGAGIISFSLKHSLNLGRVLKVAFLSKTLDRTQVIRLLVNLAKIARQSGILALEEELSKIENAFLRNAIQLVVDGTQPEMVREILETEITHMGSRHKVGEEILATAGGYAPTLGIIGTVMGLVNMLENLDDPGGMGPAIAAAFLATLYGVMSANLLFLPIAAKLKARSHEEVATYELALEGILSLQAGDNPRVVATKMMAFLPRDAKRKLEEELA
ncbi:MAG TPA: motility protein A [Armatimonadota bacterium]|nr:motility protein A [Armatimonadota bacterium]